MDLRKIVNYFLSEKLEKYKIPGTDIEISLSNNAANDILDKNYKAMPMCFWRNPIDIAKQFFRRNGTVIKYIVKIEGRLCAITEKSLLQFISLLNNNLELFRKYLLIECGYHHFDKSAGKNYVGNGESANTSITDEHIDAVDFYCPVGIENIGEVVAKFAKNSQFNIDNYDLSVSDRWRESIIPGNLILDAFKQSKVWWVDDTFKERDMKVDYNEFINTYKINKK